MPGVLVRVRVRAVIAPVLHLDSCAHRWGDFVAVQVYRRDVGRPGGCDREALRDLR